MAAKKLDWFPFYASDFVLGTATMSPAAVGCYIRLLCHEWECGPLSSDPKAIERIAPGSRRVWEEIAPKFVERDGKLVNERLEDVRAESVEAHRKATEKASKAASASWGPKAQRTPRKTARSMLQALSEQCSEQSVSSAQAMPCTYTGTETDTNPSPPSVVQGCGGGWKLHWNGAEPPSFGEGRAAFRKLFGGAGQDRVELEFSACIASRRAQVAKRCVEAGIDATLVDEVCEALFSLKWSDFSDEVAKLFRDFDDARSPTEVMRWRIEQMRATRLAVA